MANSKEIKNRIKSIKNTKKITKAMELVAASKMKRAVASTLSSRLYSEYSWDIFTTMIQNMENLSHNFFKEKEGKNVLLILVTSNRGLCGSYNAQAIKKALSLLKKDDSMIDIIAVGKKGDIAMRRLGQNVVASFNEMSDKISIVDINPISKMIIDEYNALKYDKVIVVYTDFISALTQRANVKQILPISKTDNLMVKLSSDTENIKIEQKVDYLIEGNKNIFIENLAYKLTKIQIYQMLLESNASEQSSRMMAMKNASDASGDMIDDLTLMFNKARQANITREISEISAGMASVS